MQFIPEPSAAALYFLRNGTSRGHDIVFDFGGGTLDISLLRRKKNTYSVVDFSGSDRLGGEDFDYNIKNYLNISDRDWVFNK